MASSLVRAHNLVGVGIMFFIGVCWIILAIWKIITVIILNQTIGWIDLLGIALMVLAGPFFLWLGRIAIRERLIPR